MTPVPNRDPSPDDHHAERDTVIAGIHSAFGLITRGKHGISWNECIEIDNCESDDVCEAARRSDTDTRWSELVDDPEWQPFPGFGGFSFINVEGFMYYLPPTMIRFLCGDNSEWYPGHLLGVIGGFTEPHLLDFWSEQQLRAIARFISFMARHDPVLLLSPEDPNPWAHAIDARWHAYLAEEAGDSDARA